MVFSLGLPNESHFLYGIFQYILLKISALKDNLSHKDDYFRLKSFGGLITSPKGHKDVHYFL